MSHYMGDFTPSSVVYVGFNTSKADGTPITLAGTPAVSVYKNGSTAESTSGVTLTVDFDSRTGSHLVAVDTSSDGTFYAAGSDFRVEITAGTVDSISVVGALVGSFSIAGRSALRPTVAGRTLDVSATGEGGVDWGNVGSPATAVLLSGTTVGTVTTTATATNVTTVNGLAADVITAASVAPDVRGEIWGITCTEPTAVIGANPSALAALSWIATLARNEITQTATSQVLKADDGTTTVATSAVSDDGTTFTRGKFA